MTFAGLMVLVSGICLITLGSIPAVNRMMRGLFQGAATWLVGYAGIILIIGILVNLATGFAQSVPSLTIPSMRDDLGMSYTQAGLLITVSGVVRMGASLAAGTLAPRYGSRYIIGWATLFSGGAMFLFGYSPNFLAAIGAFALIGMGSGAALTPMMGLLAAWFERQNRGLAAGLAASGGSIAIVASGLVIPSLVEHNPADGWRHTWYIFGALVLVGGVFALLFLRDRPSDAPSGRDAVPGIGAPTGGRAVQPAHRGAWPLDVFKNPYVWLLAYLGFCSGAATGVFNTFFGTYLSDENGVSLATAGQLFLVVGVLSIVSGILWGKISDRIGRGQAFAISFLIQGAGFALFWLSPVMAAFALASVLLGLTLRAAFTLCAAASGDHVQAQFATAAFALVSVGAGLGSSTSPILAGAIADAVGLSWVFALGVGASLIGAAGAMLLQSPGATRQPVMLETGD